jgi:hypothetical protein
MLATIKKGKNVLNKGSSSWTKLNLELFVILHILNTKMPLRTKSPAWRQKASGHKTKIYIGEHSLENAGEWGGEYPDLGGWSPHSGPVS